MKKQYNLDCNIAQSLNILGDRWSLLILHAIMVGNHTYKELQTELKGIPTNILSTRLKELETNQLLTCHLYQEHPPRYRYDLSASGQGLQDVFCALLLWGANYLHPKKCHKQLVDCKHLEPVEIVYQSKTSKEIFDASQVTVISKKE